MTIDRGAGGAAPGTGAVQYVRVDNLADTINALFGDNLVGVHITGQAGTTLHAFLEAPAFPSMGVSGDLTISNTLFLSPNGRIDLNRNAGVMDPAIGFAGRNPGNMTGASIACGQFISIIPAGGGVGNLAHSAFFLRADTPNIAEVFSQVSGLSISTGNKGAAATITDYAAIRIADSPVAGIAAGVNVGVSSGAGRWNIYANGSAANFFAGGILGGDGSAAAVSHGFASNVGTGFFRTTALADSIVFASSGVAIAAVTGNSDGLALRASNPLSWSSNIPGTNASDTYLYRAAPNVIEQRNSTNPQTLRVYNTFTDTSNYERGSLRFNSNELQLFQEALGTGTVRGIRIGNPATSNTAQIFLDGTTGAINFSKSGVAIRWSIDTNGHFIAGADNATDIGASGATRPRMGYFAGGLSIGPGAGAANAGIILLDRTANAALALSTGGVNDGQVRVTAANTISITDSNGASARFSVATGAAGNVSLLPGGDILWGKALVALGGGAAPTLGTVGGTGPATAAQNTWLRMLDSTGAACWVPVWK